MKFIKAFVRPARVEAVRVALSAIGTAGMTVTEARGAGREKGPARQDGFLPRAVLDIAVADALVQPAVQAIRSAARSGQSGDGLILVIPLVQSIRIRTGEAGDATLE
jgi:nitrogen regulatory protein PII